MRLLIENAKPYLQALDAALVKDPSSFKAWKGLYLHVADASALQTPPLTQLKEEHKGHDCDVVVVDAQSILFISRDMSRADLENFAGALVACDVEQAPEIQFFNLCDDWQALHALLKRHATLAAEMQTQTAAGQMPEDVSSLRAVFASTTQHRSTRRSHYVMIVEDDPMTRRMVSHAFKDRYAVISAATAHDALSNYLLYAPDIVFLDIGLPDGNGFDVLATIQATDPEAYVVMFSGNSYLDNVTNALSHGAQGFIAKPFKKENMQRYIEDSMLHHQKMAV